MPSWPAPPFPQRPESDGYTEQTPEVILRSRMDIGPSKVRKRFSGGGLTRFTLSYQLDEALTQMTDFDTFFVTTVDLGSIVFTFPHPRTGVVINGLFLRAPRYTNIGGLIYRADCLIEQRP